MAKSRNRAQASPGPGRPKEIKNLHRLVVKFEDSQVKKLDRLAKKRKLSGKSAVIRDMVDRAGE